MFVEPCNVLHNCKKTMAKVLLPWHGCLITISRYCPEHWAVFQIAVAIFTGTSVPCPRADLWSRKSLETGVWKPPKPARSYAPNSEKKLQEKPIIASPFCPQRCSFTIMTSLAILLILVSKLNPPPMTEGGTSRETFFLSNSGISSVVDLGTCAKIDIVFRHNFPPMSCGAMWSCTSDIHLSCAAVVDN